MPLRFLDEPGPSLGMIRDVPSWLLPPGALYDSLNLVYDQPGIARERMRSTALVSGAQTAFASSLGFCYSQDKTPIEELYGVNGKTGDVSVINKSTGAATTISTFATGIPQIIGRPVRHFGFTFFPAAATATTHRLLYEVAGQTSSTTFANAVVAQIAAGNPQLTLTGADVTTNVKVGGIVTVTDATHLSFHRVVSVDTTKLFTVWPTPVWTNAAVPIGQLNIAPFKGQFGGACAASFQNRLLIGNTNDLSTAAVGIPGITDRRVYYSPLPTEVITGVRTLVGQAISGANFAQTSDNWPDLNYFEVSGADPIVAMEPISDNQLLILTSTHPVVFSGNLTTQLATTNPTITFDLSDININAGCLSDLSVQRTAKGVVWAGSGGIYAWDGREPVDLTNDRINSFWRGKVRGSSFAIHGSVYVRGYYILSYTSGGTTEALAVDLTGKQPKWTRMNGVGTDNFYGVARPTDPSQVFASRWWDITGAAPSMTNGQTLRLESMLNPYTAGATTLDADGSTVQVSLTTRTITGDAETQKLFQRGTIRYQMSKPGGQNITVTAQSKLDAGDIDASSVRTLGNLSSTATATITNATNASPIVITTSANHGLQTQDYVDIDAVLGNLNANGRWRISVLSNTTFGLIGSSGSAAYTSGGKVKKLTESDYQLSDLNAGQGASFTIAGAPDNYEHHGIRIGVLEKQQVMSA